jgi:hypothetical protein
MNNTKLLKEKYPEGTKIRLICMDDFQAVPSGTVGTVRKVDDMGTIHVLWDNGSTLGVIEGVDSFKVVENTNV